MRIASTSKAFSGAVALTLVAQHRLSLDDTIARLLPSLPNAWGGVTLRELLDHTSGLEDFSEDPAFLDYLVKNLHAAPSPTFILHFIAGTKPRFTPGTAYRYSNTDNFVIALMAEAATHRSYTQLLARYVLRPLGLGGTSLPSSFAMPAPYLHGDHLDPPPAEDVSELVSAAYAWASGGIVSTPADLSTFIRAYAGGRLFPRAVRAAQLQFLPGNSEPIGPGTNSAGLDHVDAALGPPEGVPLRACGSRRPRGALARRRARRSPGRMFPGSAERPCRAAAPSSAERPARRLNSLACLRSATPARVRRNRRRR